MEKKRIGVKDLVNIGIFAVLYFIAFFIAGITGFIPVMTVFYSVVLAVLGGIPCILFLLRQINSEWSRFFVCLWELRLS